MNGKRFLEGLLWRMVAAALAVFACGWQEVLAEQSEHVETVISVTSQMNASLTELWIDDYSQPVVVVEDADIVFPNVIGGFNHSYFVLPHFSSILDLKKRLVSICYVSEELKSTVCIMIEPIPMTDTGKQMDLASCQNRMQKMVRQVSEGKIPTSIYDASDGKITHAHAAAFERGIVGFKIDEPSPEGKFEASGIPFRSVSWSWRIPNERTANYVINDKGLHGAEMFWSIRRSDSRYGSKAMKPVENPAAELQYEYTAFVVQKKARLLTAIVQSEGGDAGKNHPMAVAAFKASLDMDVLTTSSRAFYDAQDEMFEKGAWSQPLPVFAMFKKDASEEILSSCLSQKEMEKVCIPMDGTKGKSFGEICGFDFDNMLKYSKCDDPSRLADAQQHLMVYLKDYADKIPLNFHKPLGVVIKGADGFIDADVLVDVFGFKAKMSEEQMKALPSQEKILREKILLRTRQVQRLTRIIDNNSRRRKHANNNRIDAKRTAELEAYILDAMESERKPEASMDDMRKQARDDIKHIFDELKHGTVSTKLHVKSKSDIFARFSSIGPFNDGNYSLRKIYSLRNIIFGITFKAHLTNTFPLQAALAKIVFDLGDDGLALAMVRNGNLSDFLYPMMENTISYMLANGLDINDTPHLLQMWKSPRISHLLILSNYPSPEHIMANLVAEGKTDTVREMLTADATVNTPTHDRLPLVIAIQSGNAEMEQLLLENGADKELADSNGKKPEDYRIYGTYWNALNSKDYKTQKECIDKGMNINMVTYSGRSYMEVACRKWDTEAVRLLLEAGAEPSFCFLSASYMARRLGIFRLLLKHGANFEQDGTNLLASILTQNEAQQDNSAEFLKEIVTRMDKSRLNEEICAVEGKGVLKLTPACFAIFRNDRGINENPTTKLIQKLKVLEEAGADIAKMPTPLSLDPLFFAIYKKHSTVDIYSYLLSKGLDVNSVTVPKSNFINDWTLPDEITQKGVEKTGLLTFAARRWAMNEDIDDAFVKNVLPYLIEKGAKADIKDSYGKTAIDYLEEFKRKKAQSPGIFACVETASKAINLMK